MRNKTLKVHEERCVRCSLVRPDHGISLRFVAMARGRLVSIGSAGSPLSFLAEPQPYVS